MNDKYSIIYGMGDTEEMARYFNEKGFRIDVFVSIDKELFEVYFFLASTLEYEMTLSGYCSYPGLIILEDITASNIEVAIQKLFELRYFDRLRPMAPNQKRYWNKIHHTPGDDDD